jgi:DNA-directed RNA polymerase omega subunit
MSSRTLSRGTEIDTEKCVVEAGSNRFDLVLIAAVRAREIRRNNKGSNKFEHTHAIVTALQDIQAGTVDPRSYLARVK